MSEALQHMFDRIAGRYDLLNRVLSGGSDVRWRRRAIKLLATRSGRILDIACGTFDLGREALKQGKASVVHSCDFSLPMLQAGQRKREARPITAAVADALRLPYADGSFDAVMVAYGWRNFDDPAQALGEMRRVLKPEGEVLILEFFRPTRWWPRFFYGAFARWMFPFAARLLARDVEAYRYLHDSVQRFLSIDEAETLLAATGYGLIRRRTCFGGISHALYARHIVRQSGAIIGVDRVR